MSDEFDKFPNDLRMIFAFRALVKEMLDSLACWGALVEHWL